MADVVMYYGWICGKPIDRGWLTGMGFKVGRYDEATMTFCDCSGTEAARQKLERERKMHNVPRCYGLGQKKPEHQEEIEANKEMLFTEQKVDETPAVETPKEEPKEIEASKPFIASSAPPKKRRGKPPPANQGFINKSLW